MHTERFTTRLRIGIASLTALVATVGMAAFAGAAQAGDEPDIEPRFNMQMTNVPYLAWRGEQVRLVKCFLAGTPGAAGVAANWVDEDWSGDPHQRPQFTGSFQDAGDAAITAPFAGIGEEAGRVCFAVNIISQKAGLKIVKLKVLDAQGNDVAEHQFLVGWMQITRADVSDIGPTTANAAVPTAGLIGASAATPATTFAARNQIQVVVSGVIPLGGNFGELGLGPEITLPEEWAAWARSTLGARSDVPGAGGGTPQLWDIHDEFTGVPAEGAFPAGAFPAAHGTPIADDPTTAVNEAAPEGATHQVGGACVGASTVMDEVDNCLGGGEFGPFSRFVHFFARAITGYQAATLDDMTDFTVGPFDAKRTESSYIPNGILDAGDAPMPAADVHFFMSAGFAGMLIPIDKHVVYNRGVVTGFPVGEHNLWAPFYGAFIPATAAQQGAAATTRGQAITPAIAPTTASGTTGGAGNNFHGYLDRGLYHYWDFTAQTNRGQGTAVACPPFEPGVPATTPQGVSEAHVFTDEHGEARVGFHPGIGFNFAALVTPDFNLACDIEGINPLGTATIGAVARYPSQPITAADVPGDETVTKTVTSLFRKAVTCVPKGTAFATSAVFICTISARGIAGGPFVGETVCVSTTGERIFPVTGTPVLSPAETAAICGTGPAVLGIRLGTAGASIVEVIGKGTFNVVAQFMEERIFRRFDIAGPALQPGATGTGTTPVTQPSATAGASQPISLGGNVTPTQPAAVQKPFLLSARMVYTKTGRNLVVRVRSTKPTARIRVQLRNSRNRMLATAVRTVRTNRAAVVPNLRIPRAATRVTVSVLS